MTKFGRTLCFERLESRLTMAGNITATMVDRELRIEGDGFDNTLTLNGNVLRSFGPEEPSPQPYFVASVGLGLTRVDFESGEFLEYIPSAGDAGAMELGPDGLIYTSYVFAAEIRKIHPITGDKGAIALPGRPRDVAFGPDGLLYIALTGDGLGGGVHGIFRYDLVTEQLSPRFNTTALNGIPLGITFGPEGDLWIALDARYAGNGIHSVVRIDGRTGDFEDVFATEGIRVPQSLAFGQNGDLFVSNHESTEITRYSPDGSYLGILVSGAGNPQGLTFLPDGDLIWGTDSAGFRRYDFATSMHSVFVHNNIYRNSHSMILVPGLDDPQGSTMINGSRSIVKFDGFPHLISVALHDGNDRLFITGLNIGALHLDLGAGNDFTEVGSHGSVFVHNEFLVQLGEGSDEFRQMTTSVAFQELRAGAGNDTVKIVSSSAGGLLVDGNAGFDAIRIERSIVWSFSGILGGSDADRIETVYSAFAGGVSILGGAGADLVDLFGSAFYTTLHVALEADFGVVTVRGARIGREAYLNADGRSYIVFEASIARSLEIATRTFDDVVAINWSILDELFCMLGEGNDELRITGTQVAVGGRLDAEDGADLIFWRNNIFFGLGGMNFELADIA